ncbi:MAG: hypothetical protein HQ538_00805 [Parcubacteria group bacterium]|nr:hypothetical protein [Parcubacteria group bacterium]
MEDSYQKNKENFYQEMFLKYKRRKQLINQNKIDLLERKLQLREERDKKVNFKKNNNKIFNKVGILKKYLGKKPERKFNTNLASQVRNSKDIYFDGAVSGVKSMKKFSKNEDMIRNMSLKSLLSGTSSKDYEPEDLSNLLQNNEDDFEGYDDMPNKVGDEQATREKFNNNKKETQEKIEDALERAREAKKVSKVAKAGAKGTKAAQQGAKAAKAVAQTAKIANTTKWIFNVGKILGAAFSLESLGIGLLITYAFYLIQIIFHHGFRIQSIPPMNEADWIGFGFCSMIIYLVFMFALLPLIVLGLSFTEIIELGLEAFKVIKDAAT